LRSLTFRFAETEIGKHKTTSIFGVLCAFSVSLWPSSNQVSP
jgi:hypothetical protein